MRKLLAGVLALIVVLVPLDIQALAAAPFSVMFETGSSKFAGDQAVLVFSLPSEATYRFISIDLSSAGFVATGNATLWVESWPNRSEIDSQVKINNNVVEIRFDAVPANAWALNVSVAITNPTRAQRVNASSIVVKAGANPEQTETIPSVGSYLDIGLKVTANIDKGLVGKTETVQFKVLEGDSVSSEPLRFILKRNNKVLYSSVVPDGTIALPLSFYFDPGKHSANYTLEVSKLDQAQIKGVLVIPTVYDLTVTAPKDAFYGAEAFISGQVRDGSGKGVAGVPISVINKGAPFMPLASAPSASDGSFSLGARFTEIGRASCRERV